MFWITSQNAFTRDQAENDCNDINIITSDLYLVVTGIDPLICPCSLTLLTASPVRGRHRGFSLSVWTIFCILLRHFNHCHVLSHRIPPHWHRSWSVAANNSRLTSIILSTGLFTQVCWWMLVFTHESQVTNLQETCFLLFADVEPCLYVSGPAYRLCVSDVQLPASRAGAGPCLWDHHGRSDDRAGVPNWRPTCRPHRHELCQHEAVHRVRRRQTACRPRLW